MALSITLASLAASLALAADAGASAEPMSAETVARELDVMVEAIARTHPDLTHTVDLDALHEAVAAVRSSLSGEYDPARAWRDLAVLNPVYDDAHTGLRLPDAAFESYREAGGAAFTAPVRVTDGRLWIADTIAATSALAPGSEILALNGASTNTFLPALLHRMRGESDRLRARVLGLRFDIALWAWFGPAAHFDVTVRAPDGRVIRHRFDPERDQADPARSTPFALAFTEQTAILRIDTFRAEQDGEFEGFLDAAFAEIDARGARRLVIDLRSNGGGARQLSDRLMAYLTAQRYTPLSAVTARVAPENIDRLPGAQLGEVVTTPFALWVEPPAELTHRFEGPVALLIGPTTYSQAIAFAATAQDFRIARIAGAETDGPADQTGQVQRLALPASGLEAQAPLYIFTRASGPSTGRGVVPDLVLDEPGVDPLGALLALPQW